MVYLPQTNLFWKIINTILIYLLDPFTVQNFKKNLLMSPVSFIHAYLHAKNQTMYLGHFWPFLVIFAR